MRRKAGGNTLVELGCVLAVVAVTAAVALPATADLVERNRASAVANLVLAELAAARVEAIRRHRQVVLCPSADTIACATGGEWSTGFVARAAPRRGDGPGELLREIGGVELRGLRVVSGAGRPRIVFHPDGRAAGTNLTLWICAGERPLRRIIISNTGRARVDQGAGTASCPKVSANPA